MGLIFFIIAMVSFVLAFASGLIHDLAPLSEKQRTRWFIVALMLLAVPIILAVISGVYMMMGGG